jgi:hypothetical protein
MLAALCVLSNRSCVRQTVPIGRMHGTLALHGMRRILMNRALAVVANMACTVMSAGCLISMAFSRQLNRHKSTVGEVA